MIAICVPIHLRGGSAEHLAPALNLLASLPYPVLLCGSEGEHSEWALDPFLNDTTVYVEVPQGRVTTHSGGDAVLRTKFRDCLAALREAKEDAEWYCLVGANDVIEKRFWRGLERLTVKGPAVAGCSLSQPLYITKSGQARAIEIGYSDSVELMPGVNAFNRQAMDDCDWHPYVNEGCEIGMERMAKRKGWDIIKLAGRVVSIKDGPNLNSFEHIVGSHRHRKLQPEEAAYIASVGIKID